MKALLVKLGKRVGVVLPAFCLTLGMLQGCSDDDSGGEPDAYVEIDAQEPPEGGVDASDHLDGDIDAQVGPATLYVDDLDDGQTGTGTEEDPFRELQFAIDAANDGDTIHIKPGLYAAEPKAYVDPTCGNCQDADFHSDIPATLGFSIIDKALTIRGESRTDVVLQTNAGYGVLFENAGTSVIEQLTITGGVRDADGRATDAGLVVRRTELTVREMDIRENDDLYVGQPDPIVGVAGIAARQGAVLTVYGCNILNNSWDGIALYRGDPDITGSSPTATIVNNVIGCTELCNCWSSCDDPRGRGVGIGVTWGAEAIIINNRIHHRWKGIGSFGTSNVVLTNNIVRDQLGWGVVASGESYMEAVNNVIANNGTTGLGAWNTSASGRFVNNIVTGNGWNPNEWVGKRTGVWMNAPASFDFAYSDVWGNQTEDVCSGGTSGGDPCTPISFDGQDGNLSLDPLFSDEVDFELQVGSPVIDQGDPLIQDTDNTRSDMGANGGPAAGQQAP